MVALERAAIREAEPPKRRILFRGRIGRKSSGNRFRLANDFSSNTAVKRPAVAMQLQGYHPKHWLFYLLFCLYS